MHGPIKKLEREAVDVFAFGFEQRAREIVQADKRLLNIDMP